LRNLKLCGVPIDADRDPSKNVFLEQLQAHVLNSWGVPLLRLSTLTTERGDYARMFGKGRKRGVPHPDDEPPEPLPPAPSGISRKA
jgi:hypothetical protein